MSTALTLQLDSPERQLYNVCHYSRMRNWVSYSRHGSILSIVSSSVSRAMPIRESYAACLRAFLIFYTMLSIQWPFLVSSFITRVVFSLVFSWGRFSNVAIHWLLLIVPRFHFHSRRKNWILLYPSTRSTHTSVRYIPTEPQRDNLPLCASI